MSFCDVAEADGLLSGESEAILNAKAEPALILTPPKDGVTPAELK